METLLIIDAGASMQPVADLLQNVLSWRVVKARSCQDALQWVREEKQSYPVLALFCAAEVASANLEFVHKIKQEIPAISIIAVLPYGQDERAIQLIKAGACDYITKPVTVERLKRTLDMAIKMQRMTQYCAWLERRVAGHVEFSDIVGNHPQIVKAVSQARQRAQDAVPVWIEGEVGTGKELIARAIHGGSARASKPFVSVNCAMLSEEAVDAMVFGQEKTSAGDRPFVMGKLREAEGGTLLLDEVNALNIKMQSRLLAWLHAQANPLGASGGLKADVRVIISSSLAFEDIMKKGSFNPALAQQFRSTLITLPTLKNRKDDILVLADYFVAMHSSAERKPVHGLTERAKEWLLAQPWPGNVHEMSHVMQRAIIICHQELIDIGDLQATAAAQPYGDNEKVVSMGGWLDAQGRMKPLKSVQEEAIRFALEYSNGCMTQAAKHLGIGRSTLYRKLEEFSRESYTSRANQTMRPIINVSSSDRS